ncbi:hypothetical protein ACFFUB_04990 [Algimonas porphyrae]|uniref:Uncharacterized protein n=1 Tax=Algimonas porphyrae TaxID=1128113 RepID=A0ABQ5UZ80_9PROT|nr:hypothetical protein [Algimonas porphyrae]GLQ19868.1 hypothetical protein GCM10007854_08230 [Algimonas porphyrae]
MKQNALPLALSGLALVLILLSLKRWLDGGGVDAFSVVIALVTLGLAALTLTQTGSDD